MPPNRHLGGVTPPILSQGQMTVFFVALCLLVLTNVIWLDVSLNNIDNLGIAAAAVNDRNNNILHQLQKHPNNNINNNPPSSRDTSRGYDIVIVVHHDDMDVLIEWGLQSFQDKLVDFDSDGIIYAIGTTQAVEKLQSLKKSNADGSSSPSSSVWSRVYPINENIYPFSLGDIKNVVARKPTWNFQQLLKMYAHRALTAKGYTVRRHFLVIDADTVLVNPFMMQDKQTEKDVDGGRWFYCIASFSSGAFKNDCDIGPPLVKEALGPQFQRSFPHNGEEKFTAICHHMLFDGVFLGDMLDHMERQFNQKPWISLGTLKRSNLSEYELYLAWMMKNHRENVAARQVPYVNWGRTDKESLHIAQTFGVKYVTNHDDYSRLNICCVNSQWPTESAIFKELASPRCPTCSTNKVEVITHIDCNVLGIDGCNYTNSTDAGGYMIFKEK
jgi:hypothetical protein